MMERRSFLSRFSVVAAAVGLTRPAHAAAATGGFDPSRHPQDDWFDQLPGKHRVVLDTWSADKTHRTMELAPAGVAVVGIDERTAVIRGTNGDWRSAGGGAVDVFRDGTRVGLAGLV